MTVLISGGEIAPKGNAVFLLRRGASGTRVLIERRRIAHPRAAAARRAVGAPPARPKPLIRRALRHLGDWHADCPFTPRRHDAGAAIGADA